ncbi:MAG TPA: 23S rRNA (pseudouridine(1915)-N(3))-methyltransferase RlmH [Pseudothermotoga sp.]|nr:23S rRNA (pseudouridine(1915)-N(3))-methyltransferase RlmH [Pseudothermotoga sp.]HOK82919.1 23S rRNA (pseudouridine(1915)-N(3))-methyltransferase RlmH [Pseudothermotoga sp.]HPP69907.1 23S rRNA (pseudouridine(1915)-N(3))-methyltransferase RlmH [Pseudothermotoga sp.]
MRIEVIVIGKLKDYAQKACNDYMKMLKPFTQIELVQLKHAKATQLDEVSLKQEAHQVLTHLKESDYVVLLDQGGKEFDSVSFAQHLSQLRLQRPSVTFVVGGPFGVDSSLKNRADELLSLSKMTFTHQLTVVVLFEQLFRAFKIIHGQRYHY